MDEREALRKRRTGQTLAEFAITLPILLMLLFGIIEFGRIFQAWVTLQNAARAAARYATTGVYDTTKYALDLNSYDPTVATWWGDINSIVPCLKDQAITSTMTGPQQAAANAANLAQRGTLMTIDPNGDGNTIQVYQGGPESIYATFYSGDECDPTDSDDQDRRKDLARILSIYDVARIGAAGLALGSQVPPTPPVGLPAGLTTSWTNDPNSWTFPANTAYPTWQTLPWSQPWYRPLPGTGTPPQYYHEAHSNEKGWFDVTVCSSRPTLDQQDSHDSSDNGGGSGRFHFPTIIDSNADPRAPVCLLEEDPTSAAASANHWTSNAGKPWLDAGGPGDTVSIVVTFNHPLITPLGLASYIPLQARRVAVNEAFRAPRAVPPDYSQPNAPTNIPTPTSSPTVVGTFTPTSTASNTLTPTPTASPTASPTQMFACNLVTVSPSSLVYRNNQVQFTINNQLAYAATLTRVTFNWTAPTGYSGLMAAQEEDLGGTPIWYGTDLNGPTDIGNNVTVGSGTPAPPGAPEAPFRVGPSQLIIQPGTTTWSMTFTNGPSLNSTNMPNWVFSGTTFYFDDLNATTDCGNQVTFGTPVPSATPRPDTTPSPTPTVACVTTGINISGVSFMLTNDVAVFSITNNYPGSIVRVTGFNIHWNVYSYTALTLNSVWGGGTGPGLGAGSVQMWSAASGQDSTPPTIGGETGSGLSPLEGTWSSELAIAPGETKNVYLQFLGGIQMLTTDFPLVRASDFNGSTFAFNVPSCINVTPVQVDTPAPTPTPSFTPTNTNTATNTNTPTSTNTPTKTNTPTNTYTPTNTPTPTKTYTPSNTPTKTNTPTPSNTYTPSNTPSNTPTKTNTPTPSNTYTPSNTPTKTNTPTPSNTYTPSNTPTKTNTPTATNTATKTNTPTNTATATNTALPTATATRTNTPPPSTNTPLPTSTFTATATKTNTPTPTFTPIGGNDTGGNG